MTLEYKCKAIRQFYKISQSRLARMIPGTTQTEISFIENGFIPRKQHVTDKINEMWEEINA